MEMLHITCIDNIGLTIDGELHTIKFELLEKYKNNHDKIKISCINKINQLYNPKYPYFFMNIDDIIKFINCDINIDKNNINVKLINSDAIYKLKFIGLCDNPVYCICSIKNSFRQIIKKLYQRYVICYSSIFKYNDIDLNINMIMSDCDFKLVNLNEIYCILTNSNKFNFFCTT
jgi:hypothetical protein